MIANSDFNLAAYNQRVGEMTDDQLMEEGKRLRRLAYPKRGTGRSSFELRLEICRKEWRRRHAPTDLYCIDER